MEDEVTFLFQLGVMRDAVAAPQHLLTLAYLKELAVNFVNEKIPENGLNRLGERILLFRHDYCSPNVLQLINSASDVIDETLVEIVLTANPLLLNSGADGPCENISMRPHSLAVHSYKAPTFCDYCGEMLFGLVRQGLKCEGCGLNYHKRCAVKVPSNCSGGLRPLGAALQALTAPPPTPKHEESLGPNAFRNSSRTESASSWAGSVTSVRASIPHTFDVHSYTRPTVCRHCKKLLRGLFKQGMQCKDCHYNAHRKCLPHVPRDCGGELPLNHGENNDNGSACSEAGSEGGGEGGEVGEGEGRGDDSDTEHEQRHQPSRPSSSSSSPSANIPLMRIVQSVKHTKRNHEQWIKEGWLVHCTDNDATLRSHYWRLDSKAITLFQAETGSHYYKEIPLTDIRHIDTPPNGSGAAHCFTLVCSSGARYHVGSVSAGGTGALGRTGALGTGAHVAASWDTALRQALIPLLDTETHTESENQNSSHSGAEGEGGEGEGVEGVVGGDAVRREAGRGGTAADMAHAYTIHPDEVLGSGQFGVVYGGLHKKTNRPVAIKVIDKLRFPTKQEAQLKNEVGILQNIWHPGVVNLERMFESPERIFVVMEKLRGDMLEMILSHENGRLTERLAKFLVAQILVALKHLHSQNIVHCDLKPENVLVAESCPRPAVKLCDFGFARIIGEKSFRRSVVGTPAYLAPEVLRNKGYNRSLDMWSVGVIVYVSLSGTFPFNEDEDISDQIQNAAFMYPHHPWRDISPEAIDLINNLLQVKQRKRLSVDKSLAHAWLQSEEAWRDLRELETRLQERYLTHPSDDGRYSLCTYCIHTPIVDNPLSALGRQVY